MNGVWRARFYILIFCILNFSTRISALRWGIQGFPSDVNVRYNSTAIYLSEALSQPVDIVTFDSDNDLSSNVSSDSVDFISAGPALTACMQLQYSIVPFATLLLNASNVSVDSLGGVIFTHVNRTDINELKDIRDKTIVAGPFTYISAFQAQWGYLESKGIDLFSETLNVFLASDANQAILDVAAQKYPVGFAGASSLNILQQKGLLQTNSLKILDPKNYSEYPYTVTTELYPSSQISATQSLARRSPATVYQIFDLLQQCPVNAQQAGQYVGVGPSYNVFPTFRLQALIGIQQAPFDACRTLQDVTAVINCKAGFSRNIRSCADRGIQCPAGYICICQPCESNRPHIGAIGVPAFGGIMACLVVIIMLIVISQWRARLIHIPSLKKSDMMITLSSSEIDSHEFQENKYLATARYRGEHAIIFFVSQHSRFGLRSFGIVDDCVKSKMKVEIRADLSSPNIMPCMGSFEIQRRNKIMNFQVCIGGDRGTLRDLLLNPTIPYDISLCLRIIMGVARTYIALHSQAPSICGSPIRSHNIVMGTLCEPQCIVDLTSAPRSDLWQAPEVLNGSPQTFASDVYSFSLLMHEILHRRDPWNESSRDRQSLIDSIKDVKVAHNSQHRPEVIRMFDEELLYEIMQNCWDVNPSARPSMKELMLSFQQLSSRYSTIPSSNISSSVNSAIDIESKTLRYDEMALFFAKGDGIDQLFRMTNVFKVTLIPLSEPQQASNGNDQRDYMAMAADHDGCTRLAELALNCIANGAQFISSMHYGSLTRSLIPTYDPVLCMMGPSLSVVNLLQQEGKANAILVSDVVSNILAEQKKFKGVIHRRPGSFCSRGLKSMHTFWVTK